MLIANTSEEAHPSVYVLCYYVGWLPGDRKDKDACYTQYSQYSHSEIKEIKLGTFSNISVTSQCCHCFPLPALYLFLCLRFYKERTKLFF